MITIFPNQILYNITAKPLLRELKPNENFPMSEQDSTIPIKRPDDSQGNVAVDSVRVLQRRPFKGRNRDTILGLLKLAQHGKCFYQFDCCNSLLTVIAHRNHLMIDDRPDNLAASCEPCNRRISNLARGRAQRTVEENVSVRELSGHLSEMPGKQTASEQKHEVAWPRFVKYASEVLDLVDEFPYEDFVRNSAKISNVSIDTIEDRYVRREDCMRGFLKVFRKGRGGEKIVMLNREILEEDYRP